MMRRIAPDNDAQRAARRRSPAYRHALSYQAFTEALWARDCREHGDEPGARLHEAAVIRLANTLIFNAGD